MSISSYTLQSVSKELPSHSADFSTKMSIGHYPWQVWAETTLAPSAWSWGRSRDHSFTDGLSLWLHSSCDSVGAECNRPYVPQSLKLYLVAGP